jgi:hypothetical protein
LKTTWIPAFADLPPDMPASLRAAGVSPQEVRVDCHVEYLRVRWDLRANRMPAQLQVCDGPFDKYTPRT